MNELERGKKYPFSMAMPRVFSPGVMTPPSYGIWSITVFQRDGSSWMTVESQIGEVFTLPTEVAKHLAETIIRVAAQQ